MSSENILGYPEWLIQYLNCSNLLRFAAVSTAEKEREADKTSTPPIPSSIHDISNGDHILGFGADLTEDHPVSRTVPCISSSLNIGQSQQSARYRRSTERSGASLCSLG